MASDKPSNISPLPQGDQAGGAPEESLLGAAPSDGSARAPAPSRYQGLSWRNWSVWWRFGSSLFFSILLMVVLYLYSQPDHLGPWGRRVFNTLAIHLSSLVSLSVGSLLGVLGSALRWPLLAWRAHSPREVDLILGMQNPSRSLELVFHQLRRDKKLSTTALVVLVYVAFNVAARLGVAAFGLVYDINENVEIEHPVMVTDFGSGEWLSSNGAATKDPAKAIHMLQLNQDKADSLANVGLMTVPIPFDASDPSTYTTNNIGVHGLDRLVDGNTVTYAYPLCEYQGAYEYRSPSKVIRSSSTCQGRVYEKGTIYSKGEPVAAIDSHAGSGDPDKAPYPPSNSPLYVHVFDAFLRKRDAPGSHVWAMDWNETDPMLPHRDQGCLATYLYQGYLASNQVMYECRTCIAGGHGEPGLAGDVLFNFPASNLSYATFVHLSVGASGDDYVRYRSGTLRMRETQVVDLKATGFLEGFTVASPLPSNHSVPLMLELEAAHVAARLPILAILGAQQRLPRVTRERGASERPFVVRSLQVKWREAFIVVAVFQGVQLLAFAVVWWVSRGVPVLDHGSVLVTSRVLRTAMNTIEGGSMASGAELAKSIRREARDIRYGTRKRRCEDGEAYEADLWSDVDNEFPKKAHYV
ncbi:hypothetical protein VTJ83DRAFT_6813 [Remersonia thermophila]|uniref:Uncharacterized protein n=1 Tax=Remersonia thermophila TaxID=72144 RepID=A0ABR4D5S7_9PEZI